MCGSTQNAWLTEKHHPHKIPEHPVKLFYLWSRARMRIYVAFRTTRLSKEAIQDWDRLSPNTKSARHLVPPKLISILTTVYRKGMAKHSRLEYQTYFLFSFPHVFTLSIKFLHQISIFRDQFSQKPNIVVCNPTIVLF